MNKLELIGKWTGVCYYQEIRAFVLDSTMQLSILLQDDFGNLRGSVTEICENPSLSRKSGPEKEAYVFQLSGSYDDENKRLYFTGEGHRKDRRMTKCVLDLVLDEKEEKMVGTFSDPAREEDVQRVELYKGEVRRDLQEMEELGKRFVEEMQRRDELERQREMRKKNR